MRGRRLGGSAPTRRERTRSAVSAARRSSPVGRVEVQRVEQRLVEDGTDRAADTGNAAGEHAQRRLRDTPAAVRVCEAVAFEVDVEPLERVVGLRQFPDRHPVPDLPPEVERGELLRLVQLPPAEAGVPANGLEDERREHVEEVVVADPEAPVDAVHAPDRAASGIRVVARLGERRDQEIGVVVALPRPLRELAGQREQLADRRHREGAKERQLERPSRVPRELEAGVEEDNSLVVAHRIEPEDLVQITRAHRPDSSRMVTLGTQ